jgi:DnaJ-class molecular chaperone
MSKDLYKILGISQNADEKELHAAYRNLAKKYHPDRGKGASAEKFHEIKDAYEVLRDPASRATYDQHRHPNMPKATPVEHGWSRTWDEQGPQMNDSHLDLRQIFQRPRAEPIRIRDIPRGATHPAHSDPRAELEEILSFFARISIW